MRFAALRPWLLSVGILWLTAPAARAAVANCFSSCSLRAPCELGLTTNSTTLTDDTLYGIRPTVTVERLDGSGVVVETKVIKGFFFDRNGSNQGRLRARFNPSATGSHRFTFSSAFALSADPANPVSPATFNCGATAPLPGGGVNQGFLRSNPGSTQNFVWDSGVRLFPWGQTYYQIVNLARKSLANELLGLPPDDARWQTPIQTSRGYGLNKLRFLISPWGADNRSSVNIQTASFLRNGDGTLNRDRIDTNHWKAVDRVVEYLYGQGIVADLILFHDGDATTTPFGSVTQNQRLTRYSVDRYAAFPNVIWSLSNEFQLITGDSPANNGAWTDLGCLIRGGCGGYTTGADPWMVNGTQRRPLSIHNNINTNTTDTIPTNGSYPCFEFFTAGWATHVSLQSKEGGATSDAEAFNSVARNRRPTDPQACAGLSNSTRMPVIDDEYGYIGNFSTTVTTDRTRHRRGLWGVVTGGGFGSAGSAVGITDPGCNDPTGAAGSCEPFLYTDSDAWTASNEHYGDVKRMIDLFVNNAIPYWQMSPVTNSGTGTVHTLGVGGTTREYVIYSASGSTVAATNLATGGYKKTVFNPRTGATTVVNCCQLATSSANFAAPTTEDWVIWLRGKSCLATDPPCAP